MHIKEAWPPKSTVRPKALWDNKHIHIDSRNPEPQKVSHAVSIIRSGGVVIYPTRSLYGLGADATNPEAIARVFSIKRRAPEKPVSILINRKSHLNELVTCVSDEAASIMELFWPGKVTLVFFASDIVPHNLTAQTGKIGIRLPLHPVAAAMLEAADLPVTATSANISGDPGCARIDDIPLSIIEKVDLVVDAGELLGGVGSTVVDVTVNPPKILREGAVSAGSILRGKDFSKQR